jgi:hypothetical protein
MPTANDAVTDTLNGGGQHQARDEEIRQASTRSATTDNSTATE